MSLIPFILDLANELQEYQRCLVGGVGGLGCSNMDIDDVDFGLQSLHEAGTLSSATQQQQQQQQQQSSPQTEQHQRRPRLLSQLYWPSNILQKHHHHRHHPYAQTARLCCSGKERDSAASLKASSVAGLANKATSYPVINKNGWMMVSMNVKQFAPDELIVKTIDNIIIVEGRHEDKEDIHGVISRHFIRKYMLPKGYDPNEVVSTLSSDGILTVKAPPPVPPQTSEETTERIVDIQQTGPAQTAVKQTTPPPAAAITSAETAVEIHLEQPKSPKDTTIITTTSKEVEINITVEADAPLEQPTQLEEAEAIQTAEQCIDMGPLQEEPDDAKQKVEVDVIAPLDVVAAATAIEELDPAMEMAAESLAESAKPEMQVDVVAESAESLTDSSAALLDDVPMIAAEDVVAEIAVAGATVATDNGDDGVESKATDCNNSADDNVTQLSLNARKEKNGIDAIADAAAALAEAAENASVIKTVAVLPAEVPASLDLAVCMPKSVVIDAAAAVKESVIAAAADADTDLDEKNGVGANGTNGGGEVVVGDNGLVVGVTTIDTLATAAEELVAN